MLDTTTVPSVPTIGGTGPLAEPERIWHEVYRASRRTGSGRVDAARFATDLVVGTAWEGRPDGRPNQVPPVDAVLNGHNLAWDPPAAMTAALRWTCRHYDCGAAAVRYEGNEYGSATEQTCAQVRAGHELLRSRGLI